jgi:hypothetical protein
MDSQRGSGHLSLPHTLTSGIYQLEILVYEKATTSEIAIAHISIPVYNPADLSRLKENQVHLVSTPNTVLAWDEAVIAEWNPGIINTRKKVKCELDIDPLDKESIDFFSIAIRDKEIYREDRTSVFTYQSNPLNSTLKRIPVSGIEKINDTDGLFNPLLFGIQPEKLIFDGAQIDANSREFVLKLTPFNEKTPIVIADYKYDDFSVEIVEKRPEFNNSNVLAVDSFILNHLMQFQEENKFNHWFQTLGQTIHPVQLDHDEIAAKPDMVVDVNDFDIQGRVVTLFKEILTPLKFRQTKGGKYRAQVMYIRNEIKKFYSRDPLFIVNNRVTRDGDFIAQMPLQEIKLMRIFSNFDSIYSNFGAVALGGIILIEMKDPNYILPGEISLPSFTIQGLQAPIQYPIFQTLKPDIPQVSALLYWNPELQLNTEGKIEIEFFTNDIASEYLLEIVAHPKSEGPGWHSSITFVVQAKNLGD